MNPARLGAWSGHGWLLSFMLVLNGAAAERTSFNHDIRPILAGNCFDCHGPDGDARKADLRLDSFAGATADGAIVPGKPGASEILKRLTASDPEERMPPAETKRKISPEQIAKLRQWILEGAEYQEHWAFLPPVAEQRPAVRKRGWARNDIDYFVLARLEKEGLQPSAPADRHVLIKRVYLSIV